MREFANNVVLITGGGSGIGRAVAEALARDGARVAVTDINAQSAQAVAQAITAAGGVSKGFGLDVTRREQWDEVVGQVERAFGPIDLFHSNAGSGSYLRELTEIPVDYIRWLFDVNVLGSLHGLQAIVPGMKSRKRGKILFSGSMASLWTASPGGDYGITKHALLAVADTLRQELASYNIQVSLLCPAGVQTNFAQTTRNLSEARTGLVPQQPAPEAMAGLVKVTEAAGGFISPEAVAQAALEGVRAGRFFIFTHPQSGQRALDRNAEIARELERIQ